MFPRIQIVILFYILCVVLLYSFKPAMMFDSVGNIKVFGYNNKIDDNRNSLLNLEIALVVVAIFIYFIVLVIELILY